MKWTKKGHEFDDIGMLFQQNSDLYIWGATATAADFVVRAKALKLPIRIIDDTGVWNSIGWCGLDVIYSAQVLNSPEGKTVLVALDGSAAEDVFVQLEHAGFKQGKNSFPLVEFREKWLSVYAVYVNNSVYLKDISFIPSTKCNLNCAQCLNFTPYLKKMKDEPVEELKQQIDLFFSKVDYIGLFHVSGGEPILYPHFTEILTYLDENYRGQIHQLATTTNGTREYPDEICKVLREHHVLLISDDYTDAIPEYKDFFCNLKTRLERTGVWHIVNKAETWIDLAPMTTDNTSMSNEELVCHFNACAIPWREYFGGRLYACNYAHFAEKAGLSTCDESEYIDFATLTPDRNKELIELRMGYCEKGYVEFCKRCAGFFNNPYSLKPAVQAPRT